MTLARRSQPTPCSSRPMGISLSHWRWTNISMPRASVAPSSSPRQRAPRSAYTDFGFPARTHSRRCPFSQSKSGSLAEQENGFFQFLEGAREKGVLRVHTHKLLRFRQRLVHRLQLFHRPELIVGALDKNPQHRAVVEKRPIFVIGGKPYGDHPPNARSCAGIRFTAQG